MWIKKKSQAISMIFLVAMLVMMLLAPAYAAEVSLVGVAVNSNTYPVTGDSVAIGESFSAGDQPRFILNFSHNVSNALDDNLARLSMVKILPGGEEKIETSTFGGLTDVSLVIRPSSGLSDGSYKIKVAQGIKANVDVTSTAYEIYFNVGGQQNSGDIGKISENAHKIVFDIKGIAGDTEYIVTVRQNSQIFYPNSGSTFFLEAGTYTYAVSAPGYVTVNDSLTVSKDASIPISMIDHVLVTFNTVPSGASVRVKAGQNEFVDAYEENVFRLIPGMEYTYLIEAEGYTAKAQRFTPVANTVKTIELEVKGTMDGYAEQGNGGNTLTMLIPVASKITVKDEDAEHYYNVISGAFDGSKEIVFGFTVGAGVNSFGDGSNFKTNNMPKIAIYTSYQKGPQGAPVAEYNSGNGNLKYIGFNADAPEGKLITIGLAAGVLKDGTYALVFDKDICGNNVNKTLGKDVVFEFIVGNSSGGGAVTEPAQPGDSSIKPGEFADVAENSWYKNAVRFVVENGLFKGTSDNTFDPEMSMNRGMFVTVLGRLAKVNGTSGNTGVFTDVKPGAYYAGYVTWAAENGIVLGNGDGTFAPDRSISRQEAAVIMFRYAKAMGFDISAAAGGAAGKFSDASLVATWAADAVNWVLEKKVIGGNADGTLNPEGTATRAQVAQIIMNFVINAKK
ncbi:MAG: Endo-1,4-beta-xylanase A precursor [Pelotomaculum sp. PtaB.Bin104]|nr:MAG: Endo-1,4-beta-xylanase A precursor [Pelotomaculum sp. PtaB.Bin104]